MDRRIGSFRESHLGASLLAREWDTNVSDLNTTPTTRTKYTGMLLQYHVEEIMLIPGYMLEAMRWHSHTVVPCSSEISIAVAP